MAVKCNICLKTKGRRPCPRRDNKLICSRCCAELRKDFKCGECRYFLENEMEDFYRLLDSGGYQKIFNDNQSIVNEVIEAAILANEGKIRKAKQVMKPLIKKFPNKLSVLHVQGVILFFEEKFEEALIYFNKALEVFPFYSQALFYKAAILMNFGKIIEAIESYQRVVKFSLEEEEFYTLESKEFLEIIENQIYEDSGLSLDEYIPLMKIYKKYHKEYEDKNYEKAINGFKKVLYKFETHFQSWNALGLCYGELDNLKEALKCFNKAIEIEPTYSPAQSNKDLLLKLKPGEKFSSKEHMDINN